MKCPPDPQLVKIERERRNGIYILREGRLRYLGEEYVVVQLLDPFTHQVLRTYIEEELGGKRRIVEVC